MIEVLEPKNDLLKQFIDSIYILKKGVGRLEFTAYPTVNTPVALFRDAHIGVGDGRMCIEPSDRANHFAVACNQLFSGLHIQYLQTVDEIAINFKPLGFASFTSSKLKDGKLILFSKWDELLPGLFNNIFSTEDKQQQLAYIENLLLQQYCPLPQEAMLLKALELLNDTTSDYKMPDIAARVGVHYKHLYRQFTKHVGCSPVHYRTLVKFRSSVVSKINKGSKARMVDICYDNDYTDQPYFIRQFKELTRERPGSFFKEVSSFGNDKVIFKMG